MLNPVVKWAFGFVFCTVHISAKHFLIETKDFASDYANDGESSADKLAAFDERMIALNENGAGPMKLNWKDATKRDKLCKLFEERDEYYDSKCDTKRSSYSSPDNKEDLELCTSYDDEIDFVTNTCFGSEEPVGEEAREYCEEVVQIAEDRKRYCNVDVVKKYFS